MEPFMQLPLLPLWPAPAVRRLLARRHAKTKSAARKCRRRSLITETQPFVALPHSSTVGTIQGTGQVWSRTATASDSVSAASHLVAWVHTRRSGTFPSTLAAYNTLARHSDYYHDDGAFRKNGRLTQACLILFCSNDVAITKLPNMRVGYLEQICSQL